MVHLGNLFHFLAVFLPTFLALSLGGEFVKSMSAGIPTWLRDAIRVAGNLLPALGFGMLLSTMATNALIPWFFLGFVFAAYAKFGVLGAAFVGFIAAAIFIFQKGGLNLIRPTTDAQKDVASLVPPAERRRIFWRSFGLQSAFSFDRMQALGFTWTLMPFLQKLYGTTDEFKNALKRHLVFFNTHMWVPGPIFAMVSELEARRAKDINSVDEKSIQAVKGSLMGPLAGLGDSMGHGTLRPLMGGVAASLALQGNPIAPILFLLVVNAVHVAVRWYLQDYGFQPGRRPVRAAFDQEGLQRVMTGAAIAGLMGLGGLVGTWLNITTGLTYTVQKASVSIQGMLDNVMPKVLPLIATLLVYWAIRKGMRTTIIMIILVLVGGVCGAFGILK